jgi:DNA-binding XRE family transcriptional regulator
VQHTCTANTASKGTLYQFQFQDAVIIKMTLNDIVTSKMKDNRKHVGFTSEAVAELLGISNGAYSNLENGKVEITMAKLELLSKIFCRPMESFLPLGQKNIFYKYLVQNLQN